MEFFNENEKAKAKAKEQIKKRAKKSKRAKVKKLIRLLNISSSIFMFKRISNCIAFADCNVIIKKNLIKKNCLRLLFKQINFIWINKIKKVSQQNELIIRTNNLIDLLLSVRGWIPRLLSCFGGMITVIMAINCSKIITQSKINT